jgi:hypothetical protein
MCWWECDVVLVHLSQNQHNCKITETDHGQRLSLVMNSLGVTSMAHLAQCIAPRNCDLQESLDLVLLSILPPQRS